MYTLIYFKKIKINTFTALLIYVLLCTIRNINYNFSQQRNNTSAILIIKKKSSKKIKITVIVSNMNMVLEVENIQ